MSKNNNTPSPRDVTYRSVKGSKERLVCSRHIKKGSETTVTDARYNISQHCNPKPSSVCSKVTVCVVMLVIPPFDEWLHRVDFKRGTIRFCGGKL